MTKTSSDIRLHRSIAQMDVFGSCLSVEPDAAHAYSTTLSGFDQCISAMTKLREISLGSLLDNSAATELSAEIEKNNETLLLFRIVNSVQQSYVENASASGYQFATARQAVSPSNSYTYLPDDAAKMKSFWTPSTLSLEGFRYRKLLKASHLKYEIERLGRLPRDWDSEGAEPIPKSTVERAIVLLWASANVDDIVGLPSIGPMPDGRISFTQEFRSRELWIYVDEKSYVSYQWENADQFESIVRTWSDANEVVEYLEWLRT